MTEYLLMHNLHTRKLISDIPGELMSSRIAALKSSRVEVDDKEIWKKEILGILIEKKGTT